MLLHRGGGVVGAAREDRGDHPLMLLVGVGDVAREQRDLIEQPVDAGARVGHERDEARCARELRDGEVQPRVEAAVVGGRRAGAIALIVFVSLLFVPAYEPAVIASVIVFIIGPVLSPEEEYALSGGIHGGPETEDIAALQHANGA